MKENHNNKDQESLSYVCRLYKRLSGLLRDGNGNLETNTNLEEIKNEINNSFIKLQDIESQITAHEQDGKEQKAEVLKIAASNDQLAASIKATKTAVELLREEIEELNIVVMELCKTSHMDKVSG